MQTSSKIPVTLLTGFLGAGKSTLLNKVLTDTGSGRVAVIVNEFGDIGIDHDLIQTPTDDVVLLESGCICCSLRGELTSTIADLLGRPDLTVDRIVIETTGLADPVPIQQTLIGDTDLADLVSLDGVVTVADAINGPHTLDAQFEAVSQVATADLIVISKTDLATPAQTGTLRSRLAGINGTARLVEGTEVARSPALMWGASGLRRGATAADALGWVSWPDAARAQQGLPENLSSLGSQAPRSVVHHDGRIESASAVLTKPIASRTLDRWINSLMAAHRRNVLRVKGIVFLDEFDAPFVVHGVQHVFDNPIMLEDWPEGDRTSRIVVIARDLTKMQLRRSLRMLHQ